MFPGAKNRFRLSGGFFDRFFYFRSVVNEVLYELLSQLTWKLYKVKVEYLFLIKSCYASALLALNK